MPNKISEESMDRFEFAKNIKQFPNQKLCDIIIVSRYLGSMIEEAIMCMTELANRRDAGDSFDYETSIEQGIKKLPDIKINIKNKMNVGFNLTGLRSIK